MNQQKKEVLRLQAEVLHKQEKLNEPLSVFEGDALKLLHELEVYQIELELNNEELLVARNNAEALSQKYTSLYDFSPSGYLTINSSGKISELNLSAASTLGVERALLLGRSFKQFISEADSQNYTEFLTNIFDQKSKQVCDIQLKRTNSNSITYCLLEGIVEDHESHCNIAMTDITRLKHLEIELTIAKEKAEENDRLKSIFLSNMSHEIRTPLNAIMGFSKLLARSSRPEEERIKFLDQINFAGKRLLRLISDILDISKIEANQMSAISKPTNVNRLIDGLQDQFQVSIIGNPELSLHTTKGLGDEESFILTDEQQLIQILTNLIENAKKFTYKGVIEFGYIYKNNSLQFYVKDSGIGIDAKDQEFIFQRFNQAKKDNSKIYDGIGLGLSIVKGLVKLLEGEIWVQSEINKGSTFYFNIPYRPTTKPSGKINQNDTSNTNALEGIILLLVEDDHLNHLYLETVLKEFNCQVLNAYNGREAIDLVSVNDTINIILLDINMPIMNGYETIKEIKKINKNIPIIAQTGYAMREDFKNITEAGFDGYITKPICEDQLIKLVIKHGRKN